ncbi:MAG: alpha-ketoacid dehydrogenase subunit beta [Steroidobacteraceae bacterium]
MNPHIDETTYGQAIRDGFAWLMRTHKEVFVIGQGLWSPWYVGNSMTDLDVEFGKDRVLDTPVSEAACTGAAMGAALCGYRPIVVHPRMDFMLLALDQIVNQAAKWNHMLGGRASPRLTIRGIINRGGEQGAQHSQALHAWFAHVPGLRVVMPATPSDARDLLIASVLCDDPVVYIDDRWLYDERQGLEPPRAVDLRAQGPQRRREGKHLTLVGASHTVKIALQVAEELASVDVSSDVWDLRVINPLDTAEIARSVSRTGRLCVIDGAWRTCGLAGEVITSVCESVEPTVWRSRPLRVTLPDAPAPSSGALESIYYLRVSSIVDQIKSSLLTRSL